MQIRKRKASRGATLSMNKFVSFSAKGNSVVNNRYMYSAFTDSHCFAHTVTSNSISRVNSEPESHPSPSQTESLVSYILFNLQTMRFCLSQVVRKMASRKCRRSSEFLAWISQFGFGLIYSGSLAVSSTPVCLRLAPFRFACG